MLYVKKLFLFIILFVFIFSCTNTKKQKSGTDEFDDIEVNNTIDKIIDFPMPSSIEIIKLLNETGASYIYDATNPPENVEKYISYKQKAVNLGIYGADLTYTITYEKKSETASYLDNFVQLVEDLEISNLDSEFFQSVQNNLDNKDSLNIIIKNALYDTHKFLQDANKNEIALYALAGSWIESLYLVGATVKFAQNKKPLYEVLLKHKEDLHLIVAIMENYKDDEDFNDLYVKLKEINELFIKIEGKVTDFKRMETLKAKIIELRTELI